MKAFSVAGPIAAAACLAIASTAGAAGLGELRLMSQLGQPLNAEVEIVSERSAEKDFSARLASSYQAGGDVDPALMGIQFKVVRSGTRSVLRLSTRQAVNHPYIELPVELRSNTTTVTRRYTVLLDPPSARTESESAAPRQLVQNGEQRLGPRVRAEPTAQVARAGGAIAQQRLDPAVDRALGPKEAFALVAPSQPAGQQQ